MGFIRGGLLVIVSVLLFISLLIGNLFLTLSWSLSYDNVKVELISVSNDLFQGQNNLKSIVEEKYDFMKSYCQNNSDFVFAQEGYTFTIPCDSVAKGQDAVIGSLVDNVVKKFYYQEYDCNFLDCFKKNQQPFFLVSQKARDYWTSKFYLAMMASIVLIVLSFLLIEKKANFPILIGSLIILSSLPLFKLNWFLSLFGNSFYGLLSVFFSQSFTMFWRVLIIGIILLAVGIIFKLFKVGFKISEFFSKKDGVSKDEVEEIVDKKISKSKDGKNKKQKKK